MMNLDAILPDKTRRKAHKLLVSAGFERATLELCRDCTPRAIAWFLGGVKLQKRKTVLELLELACDD